MYNMHTAYRDFFQSEDRFLVSADQPGFEPDIVIDYLDAGLGLAKAYNRCSPRPNSLLEELFLRRVFNNMLDAINDTCRKRVFRRVCLDHIYRPLIALKRLYGDSPHGIHRYLVVKQQLQFAQGIID